MISDGNIRLGSPDCPAEAARGRPRGDQFWGARRGAAQAPEAPRPGSPAKRPLIAPTAWELEATGPDEAKAACEAAVGSPAHGPGDLDDAAGGV